MQAMRFSKLRSAEDVIRLVQEIGFLPFSANEICGFAVQECCPPERFAAVFGGPWEWKGPIARSKKCFYGKFFKGKMGFISLEHFPDFANYRRDGYDFDSRCDDGLVPYKDKYIFDTVKKDGSVLSTDLKALCNYRKNGNTGFETIITRLQMETYLCIPDIFYMQDKNGKPYGWGVAQYSTPEAIVGYKVVSSAYKRKPQESLQKIIQHLSCVLPDVPQSQIEKLISL